MRVKTRTFGGSGEDEVPKNAPTNTGTSIEGQSLDIYSRCAVSHGSSINFIWSRFSAVAADNPVLVECTAKVLQTSETEARRGYHFALSGPAWKFLPQCMSLIRRGQRRTERIRRLEVPVVYICKRCWEETIGPIARSPFEVRRRSTTIQIGMYTPCLHGPR